MIVTSTDMFYFIVSLLASDEGLTMGRILGQVVLRKVIIGTVGTDSVLITGNRFSRDFNLVSKWVATFTP